MLMLQCVDTVITGLQTVGLEAGASKRPQIPGLAAARDFWARRCRWSEIKGLHVFTGVTSPRLQGALEHCGSKEEIRKD